MADATQTPKNAIEQIYDQLMTVLGGTNPNQIFTMLMPGTVLNPQDYAYDTKKSKPATVEEAESRLVDQMFDLAKVTGSANGQRVSSQYLQALRVLVPKFNPVMPLLKKTLRDFLNSPVLAFDKDGNPIPAVDEKGNEIKSTLGEYYFKLYEDWIKTKETWETTVYQKKVDLKKNSPKTEKEDFLEWYEMHAEANLAKIDEAMAKVLSVLSPSDMEAILGTLASGPAGEIDEGINMVNDMRRASPSGGYVYPVDLTPSDWFLDLASDIDPVNLLKDPAFIAATMAVKKQALQSSVSQIQDALNQMPKQGDIKKAADDLASARSAYTTAQNAMLTTYTDNVVAAISLYLSKHGDDNNEPDAQKLADFKKAANDVEQTKKVPAKANEKRTDAAKVTADDIKVLAGHQKELVKAQANMLTASQDLANAGMNLASEQASYFGDLPYMLSRLKSQLTELETMQSQLAASAVATDTQANEVKDPGAKPATSTAVSKKSDTSQRFMEFQFSFSSDDMTAKRSLSSSASQTSFALDLFFGSASSQNSSASAVSSAKSFNSSKEIQIAFKATKVDIERGWFNPGLFKLTKIMNRLTSTPVAMKQTFLANKELDFDTMNDALFPAFPVAFVVAKDVSITFQASDSDFEAVKSVIDSKSAVGGGFLCFNASHSESAHNDSSSLSSRSKGHVFNITMPGPQILGYFVELTPADASTAMSFDPVQNALPASGIKATDPDLSIINFISQIKALSAAKK